MKASIRFRNATIADLELLRFWDEQPHVIASDPNDYWGWEEDLSTPQPFWREQLIAELEEEPVGFVQIIDPFHEESHYWGKVAKNLRAIDIWIGEKHNLGKGYGTQMMRMAIERCFGNPEITGIIIDPLISNTRAIKFYKKLGFRFKEYRTFENDECMVLELKRSN